MKNKKKAVVAIIFAAVILIVLIGIFVILPILLEANKNIQDSAGIHVNHIEGLSPDFIMGADVSMLKQIEISGGKYYVNGIEEDCLKILKDHGVNWIRLRIWNDPTDENGEYLGGGNNDLEKTVEIATRAKSLGHKVLLDFHYSDWWADPGKQNMPKVWVGLDSEELNQAIYDYTAEVIQALVKARAMPDMVQIGNEINSGMLWPAGQTVTQGGEKVGGYDGLADLLKSAIQAVRDNDPKNDNPRKRTRIIIHLADGGNNDLYHTVFDALTERNVDFDVIGLSYYSYWHGPMEQFIRNMNDISVRYQKDVVVAEAAYAYSLDDADGYGNLFGGDAQISGGYKATVQGQSTALRDVIAAVSQVPDNRGLGIFYWEPDWFAIEGAGWKTGEGNAWDNQAMFDSNGNALPSLNVFNLVRPKRDSVFIPATITETYPSTVKTPLGKMPNLPATVKAAYSDDSIRDVAVTWNAVDPAKLEVAGDFPLNGIVDGTNISAAVNVTVKSDNNLLENPGFETGDLTAWTVVGSTDAIDISNEAQNVQDGIYALHYWLNDPFEFAVSQTITGLESGTYTLSAWIHGGGAEEILQLFASGYGGETLTEDIQNGGWQQWRNPTIGDINVTNGECTIGLKVVSSGGSWAFLDEVTLIRNK